MSILLEHDVVHVLLNGSDVPHLVLGAIGRSDGQRFSGLHASETAWFALHGKESVESVELLVVGHDGDEARMDELMSAAR